MKNEVPGTYSLYFNWQCDLRWMRAMIEISRWGVLRKKKTTADCGQEPLERAGEEVVIVHPNPLTFGDWIPRGVSSCMDFGMLRLGGFVGWYFPSQVCSYSFVGGKASCPWKCLAMMYGLMDWNQLIVVEECPSTIAGFKKLSVKQCQTSIAKQPLEHQRLNGSTT